MNVNKIEPGDWLWSKGSRDRWTRKVEWNLVLVVSVERDDAGLVVSAECKWNGNLPDHWSAYRLRRLQRKRRIDGVLVGAKP